MSTISRSISRCDSVCGDDVGGRARCPRRRTRTRARRRLTVSASPRGRSARAAAAARATATAFGDLPGRPLARRRRSGRGRRSRGARRSGSASGRSGRSAPRRRAELELGGDREALDARVEAAGVVAERPRQHRRDDPRRVGRVRALARLAVEAALGLHVGGDIGDVDPEAEAVALAAGRDRVVEVAGGRRVDREGRLGGEVGARARIAARRASAASRASRSRRFGKLGRRPRSASSAATTSRALSARPRSATGWAPRRSTRQSAIEPSSTLTRPPRAAAARRGSNRGSATSERPRRRSASTSRSDGPCPAGSRRPSVRPVDLAARRSRGPRSGPVRSPSAASSSATRTSGLTPLPRIEVPSAVRYSPTVRSSAAPSSSSITSWKVPLPKVVVPTTVARSFCCSAAVTISEAEAVSPLVSTTVGPRVDRVALGVVGLARPRASLGDHDGPVLEEDRGDQDRLLQQAAAVAAQVEDQALGALARRGRSISSRSSPWAPSTEGREPHVADLARRPLADQLARRPPGS